jgi:quinol monooxygenase YgiN
MRTTPGNRQAVIDLLTSGSDHLRELGCLVYIVSEAEDVDTIHVYEVWESREHHKASLQVPAVREAIARAMPMLDMASFTHSELTVVGGLGLTAAVERNS